MLKEFRSTTTSINETGMHIPADMDICQTDYPLDWYQEEFMPYAEEYTALPDRKPTTVLKWMEKYIKPAQDYFGDDLLLLAHYYMGGEIVKMVQHFGGYIGDSYQLALVAQKNPDKKVIVESAVHFMAETLSILAHDHQRIYITNPKAGCSMELLAKDFMVEPALNDLNERYGAERVLPICYMNTSGRIKALTGAQGGATCTSSNVKKIFDWALAQNKKLLFIPDKYMGENVAKLCGIPLDKIAYWPGGTDGANYNLFAQDKKTLDHFEESPLILFSSYCAVHEFFKPEMVDYCQAQNYNVVVHPECRKEVVDKANALGSTAFIWDYVTQDKANTGRYAVGTENHMVQNLKQHCQSLGIEVINLAEAKIAELGNQGCGCATMSRNDPPHLVAVLDLLRQGKLLDLNTVKPGDMIHDTTGTRKRLDVDGQKWIQENAAKSLHRMIEITEAG